MNIPDRPAHVKNAPEKTQVNPWTAKIRVTAVHPTASSSPVKAFATIMIGEVLEIRDVKITQQNGQRAYVRLPDRPRSDGKGYAAIVTATDNRLQEAITDAVLSAWQNGSAA